MSTPVALRAYFFTAYFGLGAYLPFFPGWLRENGFRGAEMSAVMSLTYFMSVMAPPVVGFLADQLGLRGSLLRAAAAGATLGYGLLALVVATGPMPSFPLLFGLCFVAAFFRQPMTGIADVVALECGESYGKVRLWGSLGFVIAAMTLSTVIDPKLPAPILIVISGSLAVAFLFSFALPRTRGAPPEPIWGEAKRLLQSRAFRWFLLSSFLSQMAHVAYDLCFSLRLRDLGFSDFGVGLGWGLGALSEIVLMAFVAPLFARSTLARWLALANGVAAVRWVFLGFAEAPWLLFPFQVLHAVSFGLRWLAALEFVRRSAGPNTLATAQGVFVAVNSAGAVAGLAMWGPLYEVTRAPAVFFGAAVFAVLAAVTAVGIDKASPAPAT